MNVTQLTIEEKVDLLKLLYREVAGLGQDGDTMLAHINPEEAALLKSHGGSGTINPNTGLPEYKKAVKKVMKTVKKIAPYVAVAAGAYYGFGALAGTAGGATAAGAAATSAAYTGSTSMMATLAASSAGATSAFGGLVSAAGGYGNIMSGAGLLTNVAGGIQSAKYGKEATGYAQQGVDAQNASNAASNRYQQLLQKRSRLNIIRQGRIDQARIGAATAGSGIGASGTSSYTGSVGAIGSSTSANLGNVNVAQDVGNQITALNTSAANYGSQSNTATSNSNMWNSVSTLGGNLLTNSQGIENIFGKLNF